MLPPTTPMLPHVPPFLMQPGFVPRITPGDPLVEIARERLGTMLQSVVIIEGKSLIDNPNIDAMCSIRGFKLRREKCAAKAMFKIRSPKGQESIKDPLPLDRLLSMPAEKRTPDKAYYFDCTSVPAPLRIIEDQFNFPEKELTPYLLWHLAYDLQYFVDYREEEVSLDYRKRVLQNAIGLERFWKKRNISLPPQFLPGIWTYLAAPGWLGATIAWERISETYARYVAPLSTLDQIACEKSWI